METAVLPLKLQAYRINPALKNQSGVYLVFLKLFGFFMLGMFLAKLTHFAQLQTSFYRLTLVWKIINTFALLALQFYSWAFRFCHIVIKYK